MSSLIGRATSAAVATLCATLAVVGLVTAAFLHVRAERSLDRVLLAAAYAEAHPWQDERFENEHVQSPVEVRQWRADDPRVSEAMYLSALRNEVPVWATIDGRRLLLLLVETPQHNTEHSESEHDHLVVIAEAERVTTWDSALPFLLIYIVVSILSVGLSAFVLRRAMRVALAPLERATRDLDNVQGYGSHARLGLRGTVEVDQLIDSANRLLQRLEVAFGAQASFTAQAAHELRTPVTVLKGELELALRRDRNSAEYRQTLQTISANADRLAHLVEGLMALTRVEAGQADQGRQVERLSAAVHQALYREHALFDAAGCAVQVDLGPDPEVFMHVALVGLAVSNLLRNAALHAAGCPVRVVIARHQGLAQVVVEDGGLGIAEADRERVLERFERGGAGRSGLGLGLPLAREIARRHGGDLELLRSELGGLKVVFSLTMGGVHA